MATGCKLKNTVYVNALDMVGVKSVEDKQDSVVTFERFRDAMLGFNTANTIGESDVDTTLEERQALVSALDKIPALKEWGLLMGRNENPLSVHSTEFIGKVMATKEDQTRILNSLSSTGYMSSRTTGNVKMVNNTIKTVLSEAEINKRLNFYMNGTNNHYVNVNNQGTVTVNKKLAEDYNNKIFAEYLNRISRVVNSIAMPSMVPPEHRAEFTETFEEISTQMRAAPIQEHIRRERASVHATKRAKRASNPTDRKSQIELDAKLDQLEKMYERSDKMKKQELLDYFNVIITNAKGTIGLYEKGNLLPNVERLARLETGLKLINSAAEVNYNNNTVLTIQEIRDKEFFREIQQINIDARELKAAIDTMNINALKKNMEVKLNIKIGNNTEEMFRVQGLSKFFDRFVRKALALRHIYNPIISYMVKMIENANLLANYAATAENKELAELHKSAENSGLIKSFMQRNTEDRVNGFLVDRFSSKWWKTNKKQMTNRSYRLNQSLTINGQLLTEGTAQEKSAYAAMLKEELGDYMYDMYATEAKRKWEEFNTAKELEQERLDRMYRTRFSGTDLQVKVNVLMKEWTDRFSPVVRIQNFQMNNTAKIKGNTVTKGTDYYTVVVPTRYDKITKKDTGYFDNSFDAIENDEAAMEYYSKIREIFIANQIRLNEYASQFAPPKLGYVPKKFWENAKDGNLTKIKESTKNYFTTSTNLENVPLDPITGEPNRKVALTLHSIGDEISMRVSSKLKSNSEYLTSDPKTVKGARKRKKIKAEVYKEVSEIVEEEQSEDFLGSVTMSNYAVKEQIERTAIEFQVKAAENLLLNSGRMKFDQGSKSEFENQEHSLREAVITYLNSSYYDVTNSRDDSFVGTTDLDDRVKAQAEANAKGEEYTGKPIPNRWVSTKNVKKSWAALARNTYLGFSLLGASKNWAQGQYANLIKGVEGSYFTVPDLFRQYGNMWTKKNKNLVDRLKLIGDIGFYYDKTSTYKTGLQFNPMVLQTLGENFNQGAAALATLDSEFVSNDQGEVLSIYEALSDKGELSAEWKSEKFPSRGDELLVEIVNSRVIPMLTATHGNYRDATPAENTMLGSMALVFKKYLPEMYMDRFGKRKYDYIQGQEIMGRWRAVAKYVEALAGYASSGDMNVDEVTKKYAQAGIVDIVLSFSLKMMAVVLIADICMKETCEEADPKTIVMLNTISQLTSEFMFLSDPTMWTNLSSNPFAGTTILKNYGKLVGEILTPGQSRYKEDTDYYEKGDWKGWNTLKSVTPIISPFKRVQDASKRVYQKGVLDKVADFLVGNPTVEE